MTELPHDSDAEVALLGALLVSPQYVGACAAVVRPEDFYAEAHGLVFAAILALHATAQPVDEVSVVAMLRTSEHLHRAGGKLAIHDLTLGVPTPAAAEHYATIVADMAMRRRLIHEAAGIADQAMSGDDASYVAERALDRFRSLPVRISAVPAAADLIDAIGEEIESEGPTVRHVPTGIPSLDDALNGGLTPGSLTIMASRPGIGKSTLATAIVRRTLDAGRPVVFCSLEMTAREVFTRMVSESHGVNPRDTAAILSVLYTNRCREWPLRFLEDAPAERICQIARSTPDVALVVVDYLQLLDTPRKEIRTIELGDISRAFKMLAKELRIPVLAVSQIRRLADEDAKPRKSDLRESGNLEQDADVVVFLHRKESNGPGPKHGDLILDKNRHGWEGKIPVVFDMARYRIREEVK